MQIGVSLSITGTIVLTPAAVEEPGDGLGPELVTNGDFESAAGWAVDGYYWTISGGKANLNDPDEAGQLLARPAADTITPGTYRCAFTIDSISGGSVAARVGGVNATGRNSPGTYIEDVEVLAVGNQDVGLTEGGFAPVAVIDNLSIRRVLP